LKALIVGIDPGTNTGIVVIDENGNIIDKFSGKNISNEEIVKYISNLNNVVLIATDKKEIPKSILEISSKLNIGVFSPKKDIDLETKKEYYKDEKLKRFFDNNHEFDAYISAIEALKKVKDIIEKAKRISDDEKEYIKILKTIFRNRKIEPVSAKISLEIEKEKENNKENKEKKK
jgi:predicted RNase H-like nuclease (RuvC/YqgF family)